MVFFQVNCDFWTSIIHFNGIYKCWLKLKCYFSLEWYVGEGEAKTHSTRQPTNIRNKMKFIISIISWIVNENYESQIRVIIVSTFGIYIFCLGLAIVRHWIVMRVELHVDRTLFNAKWTIDSKELSLFWCTILGIWSFYLFLVIFCFFSAARHL